MGRQVPKDFLAGTVFGGHPGQWSVGFGLSKAENPPMGTPPPNGRVSCPFAFFMGGGAHLNHLDKNNGLDHDNHDTTA